MPSKKRGSTIKKERLMLILKSRKLTITKLAEDIGYNRRALNHAISQEYMDNQTLDDMARYLDVSPDFITGAYPLQRLKKKYQHGIKTENGFIVFPSDPSGYDVPVYGYAIPGLGKKIQLSDPYIDLLETLGKVGIPSTQDENTIMHYADDFVHDNAGYLVPPIKKAVSESVQSAFNKDPEYLKWKEEKKGFNDLIADSFQNIYDVIEPAIVPDPEEVTDE